MSQYVRSEMILAGTWECFRQIASQRQGAVLRKLYAVAALHALFNSKISDIGESMR